MTITGTHFNYYFVCPRKLWLFANGINMEHTSELVVEGKLIHEDSYPQRSGKYEEIEIDGIKVDFYDARSKVIHEIKKTDKIDDVGTTSGHVGGYGDSSGASGLCHNLRFLLVELGVEHLAFDMAHVEHSLEEFRDFNGGCTHEYGAACIA